MDLKKMTKEQLISIIRRQDDLHKQDIAEREQKVQKEMEILDSAIDGVKCANNLLNDICIYLQACRNIRAQIDYEAIIEVCGVSKKELEKYLDSKDCPAHNNNFSDQNVFGEDIEFEENCDCDCDCEECKNK